MQLTLHRHCEYQFLTCRFLHVAPQFNKLWPTPFNAEMSEQVFHGDFIIAILQDLSIFVTCECVLPHAVCIPGTTEDWIKQDMSAGRAYLQQSRWVVKMIQLYLQQGHHQTSGVLASIAVL